MGLYQFPQMWWSLVKQIPFSVLQMYENVWNYYVLFLIQHSFAKMLLFNRHIVISFIGSVTVVIYFTLFIMGNRTHSVVDQPW